MRDLMTTSCNPRRTSQCILLLLLSWLAACSPFRVMVTGTPPQDAQIVPPEGMGLICILRPHSIGLALTVPVYDNGLLVGATRGPSYFCYPAQAGTHIVNSHTAPPRTLEVTVVGGETLYLHQELRVGADRLSVVSASTAQHMLERCDYSLLTVAPQQDIAAEAPALRGSKLDAEPAGAKHLP